MEVMRERAALILRYLRHLTAEPTTGTSDVVRAFFSRSAAMAEVCVAV